MRLLHIETLQLQEFGDSPPPYFITSHRWLGTNDEVTFQEMSAGRGTDKPGYKKILNFCDTAKHIVKQSPHLDIPLAHIWIDTCCIDKTSSAELTEALNAMFRWYEGAEMCLAFLHDVPSLDHGPDHIYSRFQGSIWWKRGWTLQELLASRVLLFYNADWELLGRKGPLLANRGFSTAAVGLRSMLDWIGKRTGIPRSVLIDFSASANISMREKRSWMKDRVTTRVEDQVYCQLGILGLFMPFIYGEGKNAIKRLEDEIERKERLEAMRAERQEAMRAKPQKPAVSSSGFPTPARVGATVAPEKPSIFRR